MDMEIDKASYEIDMLTAEIMLATMIYKKTKEISDQESSQEVPHSISVVSLKRILRSVKTTISLEDFLREFCGRNPYGIYNYQNPVDNQLARGSRYLEAEVNRSVLITFIEQCEIRLAKLKRNGKMYNKQELIGLIPKGNRHTPHRGLVRMLILNDTKDNLAIARLKHPKLNLNEYKANHSKYLMEIRTLVRTINRYLKKGSAFMICAVKKKDQLTLCHV
jgi:hypothetical protein